MVTCQTLLIHVKDPAAVLQEFIRVLKPGGLLAVGEPNNLATSLVLGSNVHHEPVDEILKFVRMQFICERGKEILGEGDCSLGDLIPGLMQEAGLQQISTYLSDKAAQMIPPYDDDEQKALLNQVEDSKKDELWIWDKQDTKRYFLAGGGTEEEFDSLWEKLMSGTEQKSETKNNTFHTAGGVIFYLISGKKTFIIEKNRSISSFQRSSFS